MTTSIDKLESEYQEIEDSNSWADVFQNLKWPDSISFSNAKHTLNSRYNRYRDILPYDQTRVKLKGMNDTDYINANFVECKKANRIYILAQAPLSQTREHFWQMIWEQNTLGIVMLNRLFEKGTQKCEMYYPNLDEENAEMTLEFGKFRLNYQSERPFKDFSIRTIECENLQQKEKRIIYHCHFTNWPDFGEPEYPTTFLSFLNECEQLDIFNRELYGPCVIHCSAGVGRSGTFVLVDSMLQMMRKYGYNTPMSVTDLLNELRTYRMALVQTPQQLRFAYRAIIEGIRRPEQINNESTHGEGETSGATTNGFEDEDEDSSHQHTTESDDIDMDEDDDEDEEQDEEGDDKKEDEDSSDEDFYEEDDDEESNRVGEQAKRRRSDRLLSQGSGGGGGNQRPNTARPSGKVAKFKPSSKSQNRIKNLRLMQLKNRGSGGGGGGDHHINEENLIKTAVGRVNADKLHDQNNENNYNDEDEDDEERPFVRRDVQTVKVNQPRQQLETTNTNKLTQLTESQETTSTTTNTNNQQTDNNTTETNNNNKTSNDETTKTTTTTTTTTTSKRPLSEKQARLAEKVRSMKEKQSEHEKRKTRYESYRPWLICGGVLIGGIVLQQIIKRIFY